MLLVQIFTVDESQTYNDIKYNIISSGEQAKIFGMNNQKHYTTQKENWIVAVGYSMYIFHYIIVAQL